MSRLNQIKAVQMSSAEDAGEDTPYATAQGAATSGSNAPSGRLQQIKQAQIAEAEKTGVNPYEQAGKKPAAAIADLVHYQAAMEIDLGKISAEKVLTDKARVKAVVLPTYLPFIEDYVNQGHNYPNDVAVQVMIWQLDTMDIENGLNLALLLVQQGQKMPAKFDRDMATFLCDFFYDWAGALLKDDLSASPYLDVLVATADADQWDVHPLCISKLFVMLAKHKERSGDYAEALTLCEKAEAVNPEKAGVKGLKERLQKQLQ